MSSGAAASNKAFGLDRGLPFPLEDLEGADVVLLAGSNPAETMPPFMRYFETQQARGGALDRRSIRAGRPPRSWRRCTCSRCRAPTPRSPTGCSTCCCATAWSNQAYIERRTEGFAKVRAVAAGYWPELVERVTGVPEKKIVEAARLLGDVRPRIRADRARPRAAGAGRRQRARLHQHRARLRLPRHRGQRLRHPHRPGQRPGRPRARPEGRPAPRLPLDRAIPAARRARRRRVGRRRPTRSPDRASRPTSCSRAAAPTAASARCSSWASTPLVSSPAAHEVEARLASLDFLAVSDFFLSETARMADVVLPVRAVGGGRRHDDQPRGPRHPPQARRRGADRRRARTSASWSAWPSASASAGTSPTARREDVFDELARATRGAPADYSGITYAKIDAQRGVFWPCPSAEHTGHAAAVPRRLRDAVRQGALPRRSSTSCRPRRPTRTTRST